MPNERLVIEVTSKGARVVQGQLAGIGATATKANTGVAALKATLATLGVGLALRATINTIRDFSQEISTVAAVTNATGEEFRRLSERARELGATTRFSATDAAEGLTLLSRAGFGVSEAIDTVDDTLRLAQAGALGLGDAARITAQALRGFRLDTSDAGRVADVLAKAANSANTDVLQLGDAIKFVAPIAAGTGVSIEQSVAAINALSDAGLQATLAGTGLRRVIADLEAPNKQQIQLLTKLGVVQEDVRVSQVGLTNALRVLRDAGLDTGQAFTFFGDRGGAAAEILVNMTEEIDEATVSLENAEGTAARVAEIMDDNLNGALFAVRSATEAVILAFGELGAESGLTSFFRGLAAVLRGIAANIEDVVRAITAGGGLVAAVILLRVNISALAATIAANPLGIIVTAAAAAAAAIAFFADEIKVSEDGLATLDDVAAETFAVIRDLIDNAIDSWDRLLSFFRDESDDALEDVQFSFRDLLLGVGRVTDTVFNFITGLVLVIREIPSAVRNAFQGRSLIEIILDPAGTGFEVGQRIGAQLGAVFATAFTESPAEDAINRILINAEERAQERARRLAAETGGGAAATVAQGALVTVPGRPAGTTDTTDPFGDVIAGLERENQLLQLSNEERRIQTELDQIVLELRKEGVQLLPAELQRLEALVRENDELENQVEKTSRLQRQIEALEEQVGSLDLVFESLVLGSVNEFTDAIFSFDGNPFEDLQKGLADLAAQVAKAIAQLLILRGVTAAFGGTSFGSFLGLQNNAIGGFVRRGEPTIVGERRPELFVPEQSGRIVPQVNVNAQAAPAQVVVVSSEQEAEELILSRGGQRAVLQVVNQNSRKAGVR